jgi:hypothetical protein
MIITKKKTHLMKKNIFLLSTLFILAACGGGKKSDPTPPDPVKPENPRAAVLVFPEKNAVCISGNSVSATESSIVLQWKKSDHTDNYDVSIKNLQSGAVETKTTDKLSATVTLLKNTPYSWEVTSKSGKVSNTAKSEIWKFYNAGEGISAYAPFPADELIPSNGQEVQAVNGKVALTWKGTDTDNDILNYDIYFGEKVNPVLYKKEQIGNQLDGVSVKSATKYYWKVITRDSRGNTSESALASFTVK